MQLELVEADGILYAFLKGELDHHNASAIRTQLDESILCRVPKKLIMDFSDISFMDSSGIGLVMGRYKCLSQWNVPLELYGLSRSIYKVMHLAGLERIATLHKEKMKRPNTEVKSSQEETDETHS